MYVSEKSILKKKTVSMWTFLEFYFLKFFKNRLTWKYFPAFPKLHSVETWLWFIFLRFSWWKMLKKCYIPYPLLGSKQGCRHQHIAGSEKTWKDELAEVCLMLREQCLFAEREKKKNSPITHISDTSFLSNTCLGSTSISLENELPNMLRLTVDFEDYIEKWL